jgi:hypothetical protein
MKYSLLFFVLFFTGTVSAQAILIHSHNDYAQADPFFNAYHNKAYSIEADVYAGDSLPIGHEKRNIVPGKTLVTMYLQPIIKLFRKYGGRISSDTSYSLILMIDIKENSNAVITELVKLLSPYRDVFGRSVNPKAVQIVLSGERGPITEWTQWPPYIFLDGRPYEVYDSKDLQRVFFISDSYMNYYSKEKDSTDNNLQRLAIKVHNQGKFLRLWATPDDPSSWERLHRLGIDIINTDHVAECRKYFLQKIK